MIRNNTTLPLPRLSQTFREWALDLVILTDTDYAMMVNAAVANGWKGSSTQSLKVHLWKREYAEADYRAFRHMRDIWKEWLGFREVFLRPVEDYYE